MAMEETGITELEQALNLAKAQPTADNWNRAAIASLKESKLEMAVEYISRAITLKPREANNYSNRGRILFALGREQAALEDYNRAIELAPDADLYSSRSVVNVALGFEGAALSDLGEALELAPTAENYLNRAAFFARKSLAADALRDLSTVIEMEPENPNHRLTRANIAFSVGLNELGLQDIEAAMEQDTGKELGRGLLELANQLETNLVSTSQPELSQRLIKLIKEKYLLA